MGEGKEAEEQRRKCRWKCTSCSFEYNNDWATACEQCETAAPLSARRIGVKLRGQYYLCTLKNDVETTGFYGGEVSAVCVKNAQQCKFSVCKDERPIDEQLTEGLDRAVHGKNMAATIQDINEGATPRPLTSRARLESADDGPAPNNYNQQQHHDGEHNGERGVAGVGGSVPRADDDIRLDYSRSAEAADYKEGEFEEYGPAAGGGGGGGGGRLGGALKHMPPLRFTQTNAGAIHGGVGGTTRDPAHVHAALKLAALERQQHAVAVSGPPTSLDSSVDFSGRGLSFWAVADHGALGPSGMNLTTSPIAPLGGQQGTGGQGSTGPGGLPLTPRGVNLADQRVNLDHLKARAQQLPVQDTLHWQRQNAKARTRSAGTGLKGVSALPPVQLAGKS